MKTTLSNNRLLAVTLLSFAALAQVQASENVAHEPFAQWADVPDRGQLVVRATYEESEAYHFWAGNQRHLVDFPANGEHYGIDINQGYLSLQYGITEKWAADLSVGYTTVGWRYFANGATPGTIRSTTGLMDTPFGVRYQIFKESEATSKWTPTLTLRVGAILPGSFDENIPFAPGTRSTAIEPELLARKHFGWQGFGAYGDALFRWNHTTANDLYIISFGFFQQIKNWELDAGYRHVGSVNGDSIQFDATTHDIIYPRAVRENQDSFEAGFDYRTPWHGIRVGFQSRTVFDGSNTDKKFWLGGFFEIPFGLVKK
jgi:hypothetical protein